MEMIAYAFFLALKKLSNLPLLNLITQKINLHENVELM